MEHLILTRPPIVSAVLEIRFNPNKSITLKKLEELSLSFSKDPERVNEINARKLRFSVTEKGGGEVQDFESNLRGYRVTNASKTISHNFELDKIVVHFDNGYYSEWPALWDRMKEALLKYLVFAPQTEVTRVGMRYVNRLVLPVTAELSLSDFVTTPVPVAAGEGIPDTIGHLRSEVVLNYSETTNARIVQQTDGVNTDISTNRQGLSYIVDIDVWTSIHSDPSDLKKLEACCEDLRIKRNTIFFSTVTKQALRQYE